MSMRRQEDSVTAGFIQPASSLGVKVAILHSPPSGNLKKWGEVFVWTCVDLVLCIPCG